MTPDDPTLLKIAAYNKQARELFEMIRIPGNDDPDSPASQYFVLFGMEEGEGFNPERVRGVANAEELVTIMGTYEQTGVLRIPLWHPWRPPHLEREYECVQPLWAYFLNTEAVIFKVPKGMVEEPVIVEGENV